MSRPRPAGPLLVLVVVALLAACSSGRPERTPLPDPGPPPPTEPQPDELGEPGTLHQSTAQEDEPDDRRVWTITYTSTSATGEPVGVTGQVVVPAGEPPDGGWPVVAWGHPTTGTADRCTPSQDGSAQLHNVDELVAAGVAVVATDYQGIGIEGSHPYLVGPAAAHDVLDAVRAARSVDGAGVTEDSPVVIAGFSQGGHAALWAASLAERYAPELDVLGVQAVAPVTDVVDFAERALGNEAQFGVLVTIAWGFSVAYDELDVEDLLTDRGRSLLYALEDRCIDEVVVAYSRPIRTLLARDPLEDEAWRSRLEESQAAQDGIGLPVHVVQGDADPIVFSSVTDRAVARLCEAGDTVLYDVIPGVDHGVLTSERTVSWILDRFAGEPPPDNCP